MATATRVAPRSGRAIFFVLISVTSFFLYALGVLALREDRAAGWNIEAQGPIPVAISHLIYGLPLGAVDHGMLNRFYNPENASIQDLVAAAAGAIPRGDVLMYTLDGNGVGGNLFATIAMWMFGPDISSLILFYLVYIGISALAFICRFRDERLVVVPLYFLVVTFLLLTPLSASHRGVDQVAIGGIRYFALAPFLPGMHIFLELIERADPATRKSMAWHMLLLLVQGLLLFGAFLVRSSTGYLLAALIGVLIWRLYRDHRERSELISLGYKSAVVATAFGFWCLILVTALPAYVQTGRVLGNFWHRAFISFVRHPEWPFGDLAKVYDCEASSRKLSHDLPPDANGGCVWAAYINSTGRSESDREMNLYSGEYEKVLRNAYFYVLTHYPRQAFELYFFIKSAELKNTLVQAWLFLPGIFRAPVANGLFVIIALQLVIWFSFVVCSAAMLPTTVDLRLIIFPLFFLLSLVPRYVAWSSWMTGSDMIFLMYSCSLVAVAFASQWLLRSLKLAGFASRWSGK